MSRRWRRAVLWTQVIAASLVAVGVCVQAFSIAAFVRGAGDGARDLHVNGGHVTHMVEIVVFLLALAGLWGAWRLIGLAFLLPLVGTAQLFLIGDTDRNGGWVSGLHGLFALVVLGLAATLAFVGRRALRADPARP